MYVHCNRCDTWILVGTAATQGALSRFIAPKEIGEERVTASLLRGEREVWFEGRKPQATPVERGASADARNACRQIEEGLRALESLRRFESHPLLLLVHGPGAPSLVAGSDVAKLTVVSRLATPVDGPLTIDVAHIADADDQSGVYPRVWPLASMVAREPAVHDKEALTAEYVTSAEDLLGHKVTGMERPVALVERSSLRVDASGPEPAQTDGRQVQTRGSAGADHDGQGAITSAIAAFQEAVATAGDGGHAKFSERSQELFTGILAHELREPLCAILLGTQALMRADFSPNHTRALERIARAAKRMTRLVEDMLDFTHTQVDGGLQIRRRSLAPQEVMLSIIADWELSHPTLKCETMFTSTGTAQWDADRLSQVVTNLVSNAFVHGDEGVPVRVRLTDENSSVALEVHNEGPQISDALLPHIFEPFRRGPRASGGLGLGLYIAREIVRRHDGTLTVTSTLAGGTTFTAVLPRAPAAAPQMVSARHGSSRR